MRLNPLPSDAALPEVVAAVNDIMRVLEPEPPFQNIVQKLPRHPTLVYSTRELDIISQVVIHHIGVNASVPPANTAAYHVRKGWPGIGYHFQIQQDGTAYQTQELETVSYHCGGSCNTISVGICLEGSFVGDRVPGERQLAATRDVVNWLLWTLNLPKSAVVGHKDVRQTRCPGDTWPAWRGAIVP